MSVHHAPPMPNSANLALEVIIRHDGRIAGRCLIRRGRYVIGQDRKNEIVVDSDSVSSRHARLTVVGETEFFIEDLGSANGTFVDGELVEGARAVTLESVVTLGTAATLEFQRGGIPASVFPHLPESCLRFPRYGIGEAIVHGSTSTIFAAHDNALGRDVAMKVMLSESQADAHQVLRFIRDARVAGQLEHPGILPIHDFGLDDESRLFSVTRFVEGESLADALEAVAAGQPPLRSLSELIGIFQKACDAVAYAHARGVIHSALEPAMITIGRFGEVFVGGWGCARILPPPDSEMQGVSAPESGIQPGLTRYTAPEQIEGAYDTVDARTDVHALGDILYRVITLRDAASGETEAELLDQALSPRTPPAAVFAKQQPCPHWPGGRLPEFLVAVAMKALNVAQDERQQCVTDLQKEVAAWQEGAAGGEHGKLWKQFSGILGRH